MYCMLHNGSTLFSVLFIFFFKQNTADEMRISDGSSDGSSSDLLARLDVASLRGANEIVVGIAHVAGEIAEAGGVAVGHGRRPQPRRHEIGRASCRERVCQYV